MKIELPFHVRAKWLRILIIVILFGWMATYSIYTSYYRAYGVDTYDRYVAHREHNSMFFNPWQYRMLCPFLIEVTYDVLNPTLFSWLNIHGIDMPGVQGNMVDKNANTVKLIGMLSDGEVVKHTIIFLGFRFAEDVAILVLFYFYLALFVKNVSLRWIALVFLTLAMGNSVVDSDLTFNTYMDVIMYLLAGLVIMKNLNYWWIVLITTIAAFNRETSAFIPLIFFISKVNWSAWPNFWKTFFGDRKLIIVTALSGIIFLSVFVGLRAYYGLRPLETWRVGPGLPMLKLNFLSASAIKTYFELFGVFGFLPLWAIFGLKNADVRLKILFFALVPVWFALHFYSAIAFQTRLFLVPTLLVIFPIVFEYIERQIKTQLISS